MATAQPGDTVIVPPGLYTGTVAVTQSQLTIHASRQAVLDATGEMAGLRVGEGERQMRRAYHSAHRWHSAILRCVA